MTGPADLEAALLAPAVLEAAVEAAYWSANEHIGLPYGARVADHPDLESLRAADAAAERENRAALLPVVEAVLRAAAHATTGDQSRKGPQP